MKLPVDRPFPDLFRILVMTEDLGEDWNRKTVFVAVALEVYITAQGKTREECRQSIERMLFSQRVLCGEFKCPPPNPAPEDYQRLRNSGDWHESVDPEWKAFVGRHPIVDRWDIDLRETKWRVVPNDDQENDAGPS